MEYIKRNTRFEMPYIRDFIESSPYRNNMWGPPQRPPPPNPWPDPKARPNNL